MKPALSVVVVLLWPMAAVAGMLLGGAVVTVGCIKLIVECLKERT